MLATHSDPALGSAGPRSAIAAGVDPDLPWVMMMNGANCYGQDYAYLLGQLASQGYLAVAPTQLHPAPSKPANKDWTKGTSTSAKLQRPSVLMHMPRNCFNCFCAWALNIRQQILVCLHMVIPLLTFEMLHVAHIPATLLCSIAC